MQHIIKTCFVGGLLLATSFPSARAQYPAWRHSGPLAILTTPEGADLPATAVEKDFPLLVRLRKDTFPFDEAAPHGEDVRFATSKGQPLRYQIEEWDARAGTASIWVRVPVVQGNTLQEIHLFWGKPDAASESNGGAVFDAANGYLAVLHLGDGTHPLLDEVGTLSPLNAGTTATAGLIGTARHFAPRNGIQCGVNITNLPAGDSPHSSEAWFRAESVNAIVLGWGNEHRQGKVTMRVASPPQVQMECYFSGADVRSEGKLPLGEWVHGVHTYQNGASRLYVNGGLAGLAQHPKSPLAIQNPGRMWLGGWYDDYRFAGDIDEVRISKVVRSADWVKLEYENQKPLQTLVGTVPPSGNEFSVSPSALQVDEGQSASVQAKAGGARKVYWVLKRDGIAAVVAVDQYSYTLAAGRVAGDTSCLLQFKAVYAEGIKTRDIPVTIRDTIPEPEFTLHAPERWNGRDTLEVVPRITNLQALRAKGADQLHYSWTVSGGAVIQETAPDKLVLKRSQYSGPIRITLGLHNGGAERVATSEILVTEPKSDPWVPRIPGPDEKPEDNQFFAREAGDEGTLHYNGVAPNNADAVFLRVYADGRLLETKRQKLAADRHYFFAAKLKPGLVHYHAEFGTESGGAQTVVQRVTNLVCGDAFLIDGQSNALATDTGEKSPPVTSEWIRSYGGPRDGAGQDHENRWCLPVWKAERGEKAELGYWGMELAKRLLETEKIPIFIINAAVGGTRIDQHQRNSQNPTDPTTIYGRMLWRVREARLTHGLRAVIWHQGENDQGSDGPTGGYGWESYQRYFVDLSAGWKQDFPNVAHYYIFQIWPNSCSMGNGHGDMLREVQRTLPQLYSHMDVMSTLGIQPAGPCHYPLTGWAEFARLLQPLIERDVYGRSPSVSITAPNLHRAYYSSDAADSLVLEFDQPVVWTDSLAGQIYLDGKAGKVLSGRTSGNLLWLKLESPSAAKHITYLHETNWSQDQLIRGANGIAALTFCEVAIQAQ